MINAAVLCEGLESRNLFSNSGSVGLDAAFKDGIVQTQFGGDDQGVNSVIIAKDGRVFVSGYDNTTDAKGVTTHHIVVVAYNKDGSLSTKFAETGKLALSAADSAELGNYASIRQTADGGLYLDGISTFDADGAFAGTFYLPDGTTRSFDAGMKYYGGGIGPDVEAADGSFYLAGTGCVNDRPVITVAKTTPVN